MKSLSCICEWLSVSSVVFLLRKILIKSSCPENVSNILLNFFSGLKIVKVFFLSLSELLTHLSSKCVRFIWHVISDDINLLIVSSWLVSVAFDVMIGFFHINIGMTNTQVTHIYVHYVYINIHKSIYVYFNFLTYLCQVFLSTLLKRFPILISVQLSLCVFIHPVRHFQTTCEDQSPKSNCLHSAIQVRKLERCPWPLLLWTKPWKHSWLVHLTLASCTPLGGHVYIGTETFILLNIT